MYLFWGKDDLVCTYCLVNCTFTDNCLANVFKTLKYPSPASLSILLSFQLTCYGGKESIARRPKTPVL